MFGTSDSGASKHITSQKYLFALLGSLFQGDTVTRANNSTYDVKGVGKIGLIVANGGTIALSNVLYVLVIKKNPLSMLAITRVGLEVG